MKAGRHFSRTTLWLSLLGGGSVCLAAFMGTHGLVPAAALDSDTPDVLGGKATHPASPLQAGQALDVTQAYLMLDLLDSIKGGRVDLALLDAVLNAEGTELVVGQMNLARRVSAAQYRELLEGLIEGNRPQIQPVDSTGRARQGVAGLVDNVWPILIWGLDHTDVLRERVDHLQGLDFYEQAHAEASRFLPDSMRTEARVFAVMGGRAGAAKIGADRLYLDVLVYSFRDRAEGSFPTDAELIQSVAHEMHHMGYRHYLDRRLDSLNLDQSGRLLFGFVTGLLSEGSASYLISEDRNLAGMREKRSYGAHLEDHESLVVRSEAILRAILDGEISTGGEFEEATADLLGMWFHSAGSLLLGAIDQAFGLERVMAVVADPGRLLDEYNEAVRALGPEAGLRPFDDRIAESLKAISG